MTWLVPQSSSDLFFYNSQALKLFFFLAGTINITLVKTNRMVVLTEPKFGGTREAFVPEIKLNAAARFPFVSYVEIHCKFS